MRSLHNPLVIAMVGISFRILLIPSVLNWIGRPTDHFQGNEPSHIAAHLIRGEGFGSPFTDLAIPTAQQPPLYPLFIAGIFELFGAFSRTSLYVILAINCVAGGMTAFFINRVGSKYMSPLVASLAAWTWSILGSIAVTDITITGYAFAALTVVVWLNVVPGLPPKMTNTVLLGIAFAFMLLLNPMLVLVLPASALWLSKRQILVIMVSALFLLTPWYVRNYYAMGHFYPALRDNFGMELYLGNHPGMSGTCDYWTGQSPYTGELPKVGEARFFEQRGREATAYIMTAPRDFILRSIRRFGQFWFSPWPVVYVILFVLTIWGLKFPPRSFSVFSITLFVFYPLVFYVTQTAWPTAYRHPIEPLMALMAAKPVSSLMRRHKP